MCRPPTTAIRPLLPCILGRCLEDDADGGGDDDDRCQRGVAPNGTTSRAGACGHGSPASPSTAVMPPGRDRKTSAYEIKGYTQDGELFLR